MRDAIERAVEAAGSRAGLAHICRVHQKTIEVWLARGHVSYPVARLIEAELDVPADELAAKEQAGSGRIWPDGKGRGR